MNYNHLHYFIVLSETMHYTKAAEQLHISQPSLSNAIHNLEAELGIALFEKRGRNVVLTAYGKTFVSYASRALQEIAFGTQRLSDMKHDLNKTLRIGYLYTLSSQMLPTLLARFTKDYPEYSFDLYESDTMTGESTVELQEGLLSGRFDLVFLNRLMYKDNDFELIHIFDQNYVVLISENHPKASLKEFSLEDTIGLKMIQYRRRFGTKSEIQELFNKVNCPYEVLTEVEDEFGMLGYIKENLGYTIVPYSPTFKIEGVAVIPLVNPPFKRGIYLGYNKGRRDHHLISTFYRWVIKNKEAIQRESEVK